MKKKCSKCGRNSQFNIQKREKTKKEKYNIYNVI